jgi:hypothetical protein
MALWRQVNIYNVLKWITAWNLAYLAYVLNEVGDECIG